MVATAWALQRRVTRGSRHATISGKSNRAAIVRLGPLRWPARLLMIAYLLAATVLPFSALVVLALQPFWQSVINPANFTLAHFEMFFIDPGGARLREALLNSIRLGIIGATLCMAVAAVLVTYSGQRRGWQRNLIGSVTKIPGAISHLVVGVALLIAFNGAPFYLGGTLIILLLGYLVVFMPQASIAAEAAREQVGNDLLESSSMHGASPFRTFRKILLPLMRPGLQAGWALVFVVIVGDLTVSAILSGPRNLVVGTMFLNIWESGTFANLATLGTVVCLTTTSVVGLVLTLRNTRFGTSRRRMPEPPASAALPS